MYDIVDSPAYQKHELGPQDLLLIHNCKVIPFVRNNKQHLLIAMFLTVADVPPVDRTRFSTLAGFWCGPYRADMHKAMTPFVEMMGNFKNYGISWTTSGSIKFPRVSELTVLMSLTDAKSRSYITNIYPNKSDMGCCYCEIKGMYISFLPRF
jgi:hypothetical protein